MTPGALAALIALVMLPIDLIVAAVVVRAAWDAGPRFPGRVVAADAVRRDFQSLRYGMYNLGMCVHIAVDEEYLHLMPAAVLRWVGAKAVSVPWGEVEVMTVRGKWATARIGGKVVKGPAWALGLAGAAEREAREKAEEEQGVDEKK